MVDPIPAWIRTQAITIPAVLDMIPDPDLDRQKSGIVTPLLHVCISPQVMRDCLNKSLEDASESDDDPLADVIYVHDDLYDSGNEGIDDKMWS